MEATNRVYIGNLDPTYTQQEMEAETQRFGPTQSVWVARSPPGFAFIEYHEISHAQACVEGLDGVRLGSQCVKAQFAKTQGRKSRPEPTPAASRSVKHRACLRNLPASFTWRELKDEMKQIGDVIYADVDAVGVGIVEFGNEADLDFAIRRLDGSHLDGNQIQVHREGQPPPARPPPPREEERRPRDEAYGYGHGRDDRDFHGREPYGNGREPYGNGREAHGNGREAHGNGREQYGNGREQYGNGREQYGNGREHGGGGREYAAGAREYGGGREYDGGRDERSYDQRDYRRDERRVRDDGWERGGGREQHNGYGGGRDARGGRGEYEERPRRENDERRRDERHDDRYDERYDERRRAEYAERRDERRDDRREQW